MRTAAAYSKLPPGATVTLSGDTLATRSGEPTTVTLSAAEQLLSTSDSPSTGSTHSPTHMTVPGDADALTAKVAILLADSPGSSAGTSDASPTSWSDVVTTESADTNVRTLVAGAATLPWLRTAAAYSKLPPGATATLSGDTLATRSGEPTTVTLSAAEQLLSTSDSPSTGSTHSPTHTTVPGASDALTAKVAALLADSPGPSAGTPDASPTSSSEVVTTESADMNVRTRVAGAAAVPWLRTAAAYSKLPPGATATLSGDTLATKSGEPVTVTAKLRLAVSPPGSRAVTVTMAVPSATGRTVATAPEMLAAATPPSLDETAYDNASPSGSAKLLATSTVAAGPPSVSAWPGIDPRASGARLAGGSGGGGSVPESPPQAARVDATTTTAQHGHLVRVTVSSRSLSSFEIAKALTPLFAIYASPSTASSVVMSTHPISVR